MMIAVEVVHPILRLRVAAEIVAEIGVVASAAAGDRTAVHPLVAKMMAETMAVKPSKGKMTIGATIVTRKQVAVTFLRNPSSTMKSNKNLPRKRSKKAYKILPPPTNCPMSSTTSSVTQQINAETL